MPNLLKNVHLPLHGPDKQVLTVLGKAFSNAKVEAYRYNSASLRVRVVSEQFIGKSRVEREAIVQPLIEKLPDEIQTDIVMLLLLTPDEHARRTERLDLLDIEFDDPSRSNL